MTFTTLTETGFPDIVAGFFNDGTMNIESEASVIQLSPRMVRQLADFIARELDKESES